MAFLEPDTFILAVNARQGVLLCCLVTYGKSLAGVYAFMYCHFPASRPFLLGPSIYVPGGARFIDILGFRCYSLRTPGTL
jgi:hypothetical protein